MFENLFNDLLILYKNDRSEVARVASPRDPTGGRRSLSTLSLLEQALANNSNPQWPIDAMSMFE
jgi:hypothetical protein